MSHVFHMAYRTEIHFHTVLGSVAVLEVSLLGLQLAASPHGLSVCMFAFLLVIRSPVILN